MLASQEVGPAALGPLSANGCGRRAQHGRGNGWRCGRAGFWLDAGSRPGDEPNWRRCRLGLGRKPGPGPGLGPRRRCSHRCSNRTRCSQRGRPRGRLCGRRTLLQSLQALRRPLAPRQVVDLQLPALQAVHRQASLLTGLVKALGQQKARLAGSLGGIESGLCLAALGSDALALQWRLRMGRACQTDQTDQPNQADPTDGQRQAQHRPAGNGAKLGLRPDGREAHVIPVSTSRLCSARYSVERISCSRDTVRGNSCDSGPSV